MHDQLTTTAVCPSWERDLFSVAPPEVSTIFFPLLKGFWGEFFLIQVSNLEEKIKKEEIFFSYVFCSIIVSCDKRHNSS